MAPTALRVTQGDSWDLVIRWYNPIPGKLPYRPDAASPIDLTGWSARVQVRTHPGAPGNALLALTSSPAAGIAVDGPDGQISVHATPTQTGALPAGVAHWECEITDGAEVRTLAAGTLTVEPQVVV